MFLVQDLTRLQAGCVWTECQFFREEFWYLGRDLDLEVHFLTLDVSLKSLLMCWN
jgi:hypothetical protein